MRTNRSNNINFGRAIVLKPTQGNNFAQYTLAKGGPLKELQSILNGNISPVYSKLEARKITKFFEKILGDYKNKSDILIRQCYDDIVLLSGDDAKKVKNLEILKNRKSNNSNIKIEKEIKLREERDSKNRPASCINIGFSRLNDKKIKNISYSTFEYSHKKPNPDAFSDYYFTNNCTTSYEQIDFTL